jgi:hypothetical protein
MGESQHGESKRISIADGNLISSQIVTPDFTNYLHDILDKKP